MKRSLLEHPWNVSPAEAVAIQEKLRPYVKTRWDRRRRVRHVAGVDMSTKGGKARAAVVVLTYPGLEPVEQKIATLPLSFPYIPGLLSFRECPAVLAAWRKIEIRPDLILVDGQGMAHTRRLGIASHLGLLLDVPSVGCAKSRFCGAHEEPGVDAGSHAPLWDRGELIGAAVRTRDDTRVVYVSVGHRIDLDLAVEFTLACCRGFRLPEPIRMAHQAAGGRRVV